MKYVRKSSLWRSLAYKVSHMFFGLDGGRKVQWYEHPLLYLGLGAFSLLTFLLTSIQKMKSYFTRRNHQVSEPIHKKTRIAGLLATMQMILSVSFVLVVGLVAGIKGYLVFMFGVPTIIKALLFIPILISILAVGQVIFTILAWKNKYWSFAGRMQYTLNTSATIAFIGFLAFWNMLGFRF